MRKLIICLMGLAFIAFLYSCQKEISTEYGSAAKGTLKSSAGDCLPKSVAGSYVANKPLNDSNFIEVSVDVTAPGPYIIYSDSINGYAFKATGTFTSTGSNTVKLKGFGKPLSEGVNNFTVVFDSSFCDVSVTVLPAGTTGGVAAFTLQTAGSNCAPFQAFGNFIKDTTLDTRHYVKVDVNVTTVGTYSITTNTVNGYSFSATGTFGATGPQTVTLQGAGKPIAAGTDNFSVTAGASSCTFPITVTATSPPPSGGPCTGTNLQGTYTAGTALTAANTISVTHTYATAGTYTVTTNNVNGYSFSKSNFNATTGANTIVLNAAGTPTAAGTNTFTITFGDGQTCTFSVTVNGGTPPANTDYFPTTLNSWWSYDDGTGGTDSFKMTNTGPTTVTGSAFTYQRFVYSDDAGPFDTAYYRKDASGFYYQSIDTTGFGPELVFTQPRLDLLFLKNTLATGNTWNADFNGTFNGMPTTLRFKFTCTNGNASVTVNGKNFTNVYQVKLQLQLSVGGVFLDAGDPLDYFYAKGIGQIRLTDGTDFQDIRSWVVN